MFKDKELFDKTFFNLRSIFGQLYICDKLDCGFPIGDGVEYLCTPCMWDRIGVGDNRGDCMGLLSDFLYNSWHDIEHDPDDVPRTEAKCVLCIRADDVLSYMIADWIIDDSVFFNNTFDPTRSYRGHWNVDIVDADKRIIGWKYLKLYE